MLTQCTSFRSTCLLYWQLTHPVDAQEKVCLATSSAPICRAKGGKRAPPAQIVPDGAGRHGEVVNSILSSGAMIRGPSVIRSILSPDVLVNEVAIVDHSLLFEGVVVVPRKYQFRHSSAKGSATLTQATHSQP